MPLAYSAILVFLISLVGLLFLKPLLKDKLNQTSIYMFLLWSFILSFYGRTPYVPTQWDEFSHWVTYPVQLTQLQTLVSPQFYNLLTLTYPPLYPLTVAYPNLLLSLNPLETNYMIVPLLSWIAFFAGIYPYIKKAFFGLALPLILSLLFLKGLPTDLLIEWPQLHLMSLLFIVASGGFPFKKKNEVILIVLLTVLLIYLKNSNFFLLVPISLFLLSRKQYQSLFIIISVVLTFTVPGLMYWKAQASFVEYPFQPRGLIELPIKEFVSESGFIFLKMLKKMFNFLGYFEVLLSVILVSLSLKKKGIRILRSPIFLTLFLYFFVMFSMYVVFFNPYEAKQIASFERYYSLILLPLCFSYIFRERKSLARPLKSWKKNQVVTALILIGLFRFIEPQIRIQGEGSHFIALWDQVMPHLSAGDKKGLFVSQGDDGSDFVQIRYASLESYPQNISWGDSYSFSKKPGNFWAVGMGDSFQEYLSKFDFILIYKDDEEMDSQLAKLSGVQYKNCLKSGEAPILFQKINKGWSCQILH